jgi:gamma-glutamyltranspeptidase/glutathione hydrolase
MTAAILVILFTSLTVGAASAEATHGMVATVHPVATEAGLRVLKEGGNAIDATVAVA